MHRSGLGSVLVCFLGMAACSSTDTTGSTGSTSGGAGGGATSSTGSGETSGSSSSATTAGAGGGACNALALPPVVKKTADPAALPAFTGGPIADGTYVVTSVVDYGTSTPGGTSLQEIYELVGGVAHSAIASSEMAETHFAGTYATTMSTLSYSLTCPGPFSVSMSYTATPTTLAFQHGSDPNEVAYAMKQ
jgi:hypothetical protein